MTNVRRGDAGIRTTAGQVSRKATAWISSRGSAPGRWAEPCWTRVGKVDTGEVRKRLLLRLLACEVGLALAVALLLPFLFLKLPLRGDGIANRISAEWMAAMPFPGTGTISKETGPLAGLSSQATCLLLALPIAMLLFAVGVTFWWSQRIRHTEDGNDSDRTHEPGNDSKVGV